MNRPHTIAVVRSFTCTCCSRRGARTMIRLGEVDRPNFIAVCPACDTRPSDITAEDVTGADAG
ncbi:hypothetical protein EV383_2196 [Pseudonocardia sediminis]|uniref:Uncharacterized protein n=1 Tax=Pseudonocardia sediminis TaxID=1397368 RepID=A0A4Q7UWQ3_PSEST|nr:hypothetical protein [Pseudonocardia sediminis]RZT85331.1 hypothetical protein EV383_2196 [Pseudonocardia sediminis]